MQVIAGSGDDLLALAPVPGPPSALLRVTCENLVLQVCMACEVETLCGSEYARRGHVRSQHCDTSAASSLSCPVHRTLRHVGSDINTCVTEQLRVAMSADARTASRWRRHDGYAADGADPG